jgi:hypothetical protein
MMSAQAMGQPSDDLTATSDRDHLAGLLADFGPASFEELYRRVEGTVTREQLSRLLHAGVSAGLLREQEGIWERT